MYFIPVAKMWIKLIAGRVNMERSMLNPLFVSDFLVNCYECKFTESNIAKGAWGSVVVKALRY
jgi:hypothetical protein